MRKMIAILGSALFLVLAPCLAAGLIPACHAFVVAYEEPTLARTFGVEYEAFRASAPLDSASTLVAMPVADPASVVADVQRPVTKLS
jgi:hypothetical protein